MCKWNYDRLVGPWEAGLYLRAYFSALMTGRRLRQAVHVCDVMLPGYSQKGLRRRDLAEVAGSVKQASTEAD
jgi:hypothetical protein